jgi:nucleotide-binding universal stress UspA family protein
MAANRELRLFGKILLAYDGSADSIRALSIARELALACKSRLYLIGNELLPESSCSEAFRVAVDSAVKRYADAFYRIRLAGMNEGLPIETFIALGDPVACIVAKARQLRVSLLIIVAKESLFNFESMLRGAPCAVLFMRGSPPPQSERRAG